MLGIVPFAAVAAPRRRSSRWSGGGLPGIVTFAAAAALRLRPFRWPGGGLPGMVPIAAVAALRLRVPLFLHAYEGCMLEEGMRMQVHLMRKCGGMCDETGPLTKRGRVEAGPAIPISVSLYGPRP